MNRSELQRLSRLRAAEARVLLDNGYFAGAYYLLGYSLECALKACIAKQVTRYDFPDLGRVRDSYTHDLGRLLGVSGLKDEFEIELRTNPAFAVNWAIVQGWSESSRYDVAIRDSTARDFYSAVTTRRNGVLPWLTRRW